MLFLCNQSKKTLNSFLRDFFKYGTYRPLNATVKLEINSHDVKIIKFIC